MVRQAMVYGLKTLPVTKKQIEEKEVEEIKVLRLTMRVTRKDKIKNECIRGIVNGAVRRILCLLVFGLPLKKIAHPCIKAWKQNCFIKFLSEKRAQYKKQ